MKAKQTYNIANRTFSVSGSPLVAAVRTLPGFDTFLSREGGTPCFQIHTAAIEEVPVGLRSLYKFEAEGVYSEFSSWEKGHHLSMVREADGARLDMWSVSAAHRVYLSGELSAHPLRFALWLAYGLMTVNDGRIAIHASCIVDHGRAYLFLGESGTGKSTHTRLWREYIPGSFLLNDDSPIIVVEHGEVWIYGSPWSGKTPCYRQERYPLRACVRLSQAPYNRMERLDVFHSLAALHPSCPPAFSYDNTLYAGIVRSLDQILAKVAVFHLECLPDKEAALLSHDYLTQHLFI